MTTHKYSSLQIAVGNGDGTFRPATSFGYAGAPEFVADLSGDRNPDVLASGDVPALYRGDGRGGLEPADRLRRAKGYLVGLVIARSRRRARARVRARIVRLYADFDVSGSGTVLAQPVR